MLLLLHVRAELRQRYRHRLIRVLPMEAEGTRNNAITEEGAMEVTAGTTSIYCLIARQDTTLKLTMLARRRKSLSAQIPQVAD